MSYFIPFCCVNRTVYGLKMCSVLNSSYRMFLRFTILKPCCSWNVLNFSTFQALCSYKLCSYKKTTCISRPRYNKEFHLIFKKLDIFWTIIVYITRFYVIDRDFCILDFLQFINFICSKLFQDRWSAQFLIQINVHLLAPFTITLLVIIDVSPLQNKAQ